MLWRRLAILLTGFLLAGCGGLGGEPEIVATQAPREVSTSDSPNKSDWRPDIANGALIFAESCVECHGINGDGQGDLVKAGSVAAPIDMTDRELVSAKSPLEWFEIITEGRIENLMPPWKNALSEGERWDVTLYGYTLAYDEALLALGERVWRERCSNCALPATIPPVYSDADYGAKLNRELFGSALAEEEVAAAVAYTRMKSLEVTTAARRQRKGLPRSHKITSLLLARARGFVKKEDDVVVRTSPLLGAIDGRVAHGTAGGVVPAGTVVQLQFGKSDVGFTLAETTTDADSNFNFADIPLTKAFEYVVGAVYGERLFSRRLPAGDLPGSEDEWTITVYDSTADAFVVDVARIDLFIEPVKLDDLGAGLYISQIVRYRNSSDRIYTSGRGFDDGREAALLIQLPAGTRLLSGDENGRYVVIEDMEQLPDSVIDTLPVMPGEAHDVVLEYFLPYEAAAQFEQEFNNLIDAEVTATVSEELQLEGDLLLLQEPAADDEIDVYSGDLRMESEPRLSFGISGDPFATSSDDGMVITSETLPPLLIGAFALVAALLAGFGVIRRRKDDSHAEIKRLVQELARLEDDHDQGQINHDLYHHRRRELKAKLAQLMEVEA